MGSFREELANTPGIVDPDAFYRATVLLLFEIPAHIQECYRCRRADFLFDQVMGAELVDKKRGAEVSRMFCTMGNAMIQEYSRAAYKGLGKPYPPDADVRNGLVVRSQTTQESITRAVIKARNDEELEGSGEGIR